jgi:hypothetical protein
MCMNEMSFLPHLRGEAHRVYADILDALYFLLAFMSK